MTEPTLRLDGKKILITGVSRPLGIGATLAKRLAEAGATVAIHGFSSYDLTVGENNSATPNGTEKLAKQYQDLGLNVILITPSDFSQKGTAVKVVEETAQKLGGLDGMILNHCYGVDVPIGEWTEEHIDPHLFVNVRASMIMIQAFAAQVDTTKDNTIILFSSGQYKGIQSGQMSYAVTKDAVVSLFRQSAHLLRDRNIRVNCIDPGPCDTGYLFGDDYEEVARMFPSGKWGTPNDTADLALFLHSNYAKWITGQLISSNGGSEVSSW